MFLRRSVVGSPGRLALVAVVVAGTAAGAVAGAAAPRTAVAVSSHAGATRTAALEVMSAFKPVNKGLLMRGDQPPPGALAGVVHGYIIQAPWAAMQPAGPKDFVTTPIDNAVSAVRAWNAANPTNQRGLRLRVYAGIESPHWVKAMAGGPVVISDPLGKYGYKVPRWWTQPVQAAYTAWIAKLAAYVDPIPEVREVTVGLTIEFYGQGFLRFPTQNAAPLQAAGYTQALDIAAMQASFRAHAAFQRTTTQIDVSGYQTMTGAVDFNVTRQLMDYARSVLRSVQFTNANFPSLDPQMYALFKAYGPKGGLSNPSYVTFQTQPQVSSVAVVLKRAATYGATSIEIPVDPGTPSALAPLDGALTTNLGLFRTVA